MKIVYVNWAPLWRGAEVGGGVNLYSQSMAVNLHKSGHALYSISAGFAYDFTNRAYIKRGPDYMGVKNYEIFNSPNIAPGFFNYNNPLQDISEPVVEKLFTLFIDHIKPDVVHFHNIEGFSAKCIKIAKNKGCRVIFSLHNYHPVCNQIYLLYKDNDICKDFNNGLKCLDCISPPPYKKEVVKRMAASHVYRLPAGDRIWRRGERAVNIINGMQIVQKSLSFIKNVCSKYSYEEKELKYKKNLLYAKRRNLIIKELNNAHLIHAVSDFVKNFYISQGIKPEIIKTCHIGNKMAEIGKHISTNSYKNKELSLLQKDQLLLQEEENKDKPLNIIFLGIASKPKGLSFLLETLLYMDRRNFNDSAAVFSLDNYNKTNGNKNIKSVKEESILKKISLHIHARGVWELKSLIEPLYEKLYSLEIHDGYNFNNLPNILDEMNYGIVPPLWYDNAPQVVFEMMAMKVPVIGANIGGIPDFVKDMDNGILFKPGDKGDLASKIEMIIKERYLELQFKNNIKPMKTPDEHALELERIYTNKIS